MKRILAGSVLISILVLFGTARGAVAQTCSNVLSTLLAAALQPELAKLEACKDLKQEVKVGLFSVTLGIDKTDRIELRTLSYCPADPMSHVDATVYVRCKTSDQAVVHLTIDETFEFSMTLRNDTCEIDRFDVTPRGEIGRAVAGLLGLSDRMKRAAAQPIRTLCK
jgi:hypothetical protein